MSNNQGTGQSGSKNAAIPSSSANAAGAASATAGAANAEATGSQANQANNDLNVLFQSKDAQTMISVLKDMGIDDYEPRVVYQLLEFSYRYTTNLLEDAKAFSVHAGKKTIDSEDIKMAIKSKVDYSFTTTPPRDLLLEISKTKNKNPLPPIRYHSGIRLPPDRFCLHAPNFCLKTPVIPEHYEHKQPEQINSNNKQSQMQQSANMSNLMRTESFGSMPIKRPRDEDDYDI